MQLDSKAGLMLGAMFVLGAAVGVIGRGAWQQQRVAPVAAEGAGVEPSVPADAVRRRDGSPRDSRFVSELERFLSPRDSAQRARLRPHLLSADSANSIYVRTARDSMGQVIRRLRDDIAPLLDAEQLARLDAWIAQPWDDRRPRQPGGRGGADRPPRERGAGDGAPKPPGDPLRKNPG